MFRIYCKAILVMAKDGNLIPAVKEFMQNLLQVLLSKTNGKRRQISAAAMSLLLFASFTASFGPLYSDIPFDISYGGVPLAEAAVEESDEDEVHEEEAVIATYAIVADGKEIVRLASREEADAVLDGVIGRYKTRGSEIIDLKFKESVTIIEKGEKQDGLFSVEDAITYVLTGTTEPITYIVKGGDNLWDISRAHGIKLSELEAMNPNLDPKRLRIGQTLHLFETNPFITVSFTEQVKVEERIPYQVVYENNDGMYRGQTQVKSAGVYGSREVVSEITRENGLIVSSVILSETVISEPVTQVAYRGTQAIPVFSGTTTGELSQPVAGMNVISNYGSRGGRQHHGVDLGGPRGTPIFAAADGVVIFAGRSGTFGNIVRLCHGEGLQTWYAHNDTHLVDVGETVARGQQIATMGATGNATTSHLHFEVRINGQSRNPMNYI